MAYWNLYFIAKFVLFYGDHIDFHLWPNLLFAVALIPEIRNKHWRTTRQVLAFPVAFVLLYHDTRFPTLRQILAHESDLAGFSLGYVLELAQRLIEPKAVLALAIAATLFWFAKRWLRITSFVMLTMLLGVPVWSYRSVLLPAPVTTVAASAPTSKAAAPWQATAPSANVADSATLDNLLAGFYRSEATRQVNFGKPADGDAPFDIIFLQICSLAWDDLDFVGDGQPPLFNKLDLVFRNFSSGASYSGPAAIRLLRASCGQRPHAALYGAAPAQCFVMRELEQAGFQTQFLMNHDGHFGGFIADVQQRGQMSQPPFPIGDTPVYLKAFDETPIRDDYAVLEKWWKSRLGSPVQRVGLYYNTISLHDGNHYPGAGPGASLKTYKPRLEKLLADVDRFLNLLASSGRHVAVVFVPEHGAGLRGDRIQIAGLREIPTPRISLVPVGVKLIGSTRSQTAPLVIDKPSSYLALSKMLANFIARDPFANNSPAIGDYLNDLPQTEFAAENGDVLIFRYSGRYYLHNKGEDWSEYLQ